MDYYVTVVTAYGVDIVGGPFGARAAAEALRRRCGGAAPAPPPLRRGLGDPAAADAGGPAARGVSYAVTTGEDLRRAWARGRVYRW